MIDIFFHVLNFLVLCFVLRYVFKKYFFERISQAMVMAHAAYANALKRNEQLRKQEQGLVRAYYHQNYRYEELSRKTELWNHKIEQDYQLQLKQKEAVLQKLDQRSCHQQRHLQSLHVSLRVVEEVIEEVQNELKSRLDKNKTQVYTQRLIERITRKHDVQ